MLAKESSCADENRLLVGLVRGASMGETQQAYAMSETESGIHDKDIPFEQLAKKDVGEFDSGLLDTSESYLHNGTENGPNFAGVKDKEPHHQREAVIRPQQAGKIDFKSLHNRPKFPSDGPWGTVKGSPQSPTGKSRAREKNRRAGKCERGHHQLYRLTISNARPNPTIGIAYPQQKVTPPKKVDTGRGPISGSYRFHVPSIPEREVELQQEDLGFARGFPEASSSHIPSNYTSATATARSNHSAKIQPPAGVLPENASTNGQLRYLEFQGSGNNSWPLPEKSLPGANGGLPASKPCSFPESSKPGLHSLGPLSFQYPFQPLRNSAADPFQGDADTQDYVDVSLATSQASHGAFAFHSSSRDWKEEALGSGPYDDLSPESRAYGLAAPPSQFLPSQAQGPLPCYKGRNEQSTDPTNGALSPSGAIDQTPSTFQENQAVFPHGLHVSSMPKPVGKRQSSCKDSVASQRILDPGSSLRRNTPQISLPQVHFQNKLYTDPPAGSVSPSTVPFEKSLPATAQAHPRLLQAWEGGKRPYSPLEASSTPYLSTAGNQLSFGCHLGPEQRQHRKKTWQHLHLTSAMPGQNRIELSRKLASQKLPFPLGTSEWDGTSKAQKGGAGYPSKALLTGEGAIIQRHDPVPQSSANTFCFEGALDAKPPPGCGSRTKALYFSMSQAGPPATSRLPSGSALAASPSNSPLPSPAPTPNNNSSSCSSLSPLSSSPTSHGFEDSTTLTASPYFHHPCHPKDGNKPFHASEPVSSSSVHYQAADSVKPFQLSQDTPKDKLFYKGLAAADNHFHKPNVEVPKGCLEGFEAELPPPPYSSHHLLAHSLSSASLDQLDVFLTCKQCDQNFSHLSSFLEHRQFCSSHHMALQGQTKDSSRGTEIRRQQQQQHHSPAESMKPTQAGPGLLPPPDLHVQLLPLNKTVDFLADGEGRGEAKEDPLKVTQLGSLATNPLPLSASDLEMDDAKLDSLITEALNGLGYQSDNPEIDSSFIDVFADEELASVKVSNSGTPYKAKEGLASGKKAKHVGADESVKALSCSEDRSSGDPAKSRMPGKQHGHKDGGAGWFPDHGDERHEKQNSTELVRNKVTDPRTYERAQIEASTHLKAGRKACSSPFPSLKQAPKSVSEAKRSSNVPRADSPVSRLWPVGTPAAAGDTELSAKDTKKQQRRSGTWSKELIQKIVQQKNKLHKRQSKSSRMLPLPLRADRLLPEAKDSKFGEYEYISESDDERVEYAKQHCRRKLGSRLSGRLRSGFSRRCPGRGGREKDKEPVWRYGQRRDREEPKRATGKDPGRRDDCAARVRRRSCRSSTSSRQSTSLSSETSTSPQSTERADSDTEKESEPWRKHLQSPKRVGPHPRELLNVPGKETVGRSHKMASDASRVDSADSQQAGFRAHQRGSPTLSPITYTQGDEGLQQTQEGPHRSKETLGKAPNTPGFAEDSERYQGSLSHGRDQAKAASKELDPCALGMNPHWRQFTASSGEALDFPVEELISPSSAGHQSIPNDDSTSYEKADAKFLKKQKEVTPPISCFNDNLVGLGIAEKRSDPLVSTADTFYDCSELSSSYESPGLFPGPPATAPPHNNSVYFCQEDTELGPFKQKHPEISPYEANNEQRKVPLPLSFDSSPVFGELPVAEFDATLYDGVTSSKDNYVAFACAGHQLGKMIPFDQHYSSFLHEKDWNIMDEVSPVLPDDIAQFHNLPVEKPLAKKYSGVVGQMPLPLPERMPDYTVPFMSGISDDELEIKRLVTELESQLQTSKLNMEASDEHETSKHQTGLERKDASSQFSTLTLDQESDGKGLFLMESEFENANLVSPKACLCENSVNEKTLLPPLDGKYGNPRDPWPCPVPYSPLHSTAAELILVGPFNSKEAPDKLHENLKDVDISTEDHFREIQHGPTRVTSDSCLSNVADNIQAPSYTENLIESPDPLFPKTLEGTELHIHETLPARADAFPELQQKETMFDDTAGLGPAYSRPTPCLKREFELQEAGVQETESNLTSRTQNIKDPEERLFCKATLPETLENQAPFQKDKDGPALLEEAEETESAPTCQTPGSCDKADDGKTLLLDSLTFSKEMGGTVEFAPAPQVKGANPLQQLQLFVARTVKHNEEDLLVPCFPVLHSATHLPPGAHVQPEQEEEATDSMPCGDVADSPTFVEGKGSVGEELESVASTSNPTKQFLEPDKQVEHLGEKVSYALEPLGLQGSDLHKNVTEQQRLKDECSEVGDINMCADGSSPEHRNLSPLSNSMVTSLLREKGTQGARVTDEVEQEQEKATLAFKNHQKSPLSPGSFEKEAPDCPLPAVLRISVAGCTSWGEACCAARGVCPVKAHQKEEFGDPLGQLRCNLSLVPTNPPENQYQDDFLQHQTSPVLAEDCGLDKQASHHADASQDGFPVEGGFADGKHKQENNAGNVVRADLGACPSEEARCLASGEDLPVHQYSPNAEKAVVGDPTQSPSEHKKWKEAVPIAPLTQCCGDTTHLSSNRIGSGQQHLAEDTSSDSAELQNEILPQAATSLHSGDPAATLLDIEGGLKLQNNNGNSPSLSPVKHKDLSEGSPKSPVREDSETCSVRNAISSSQSDSLPGILLGQFPPGTDSAPLTDARTDKNVESTLNLQGGREVETSPQKCREDQTQPEIRRKNVELQETPDDSLTAAAANNAEVHLCTNQFPEMTRPNIASQDSERENKDSKQSETVEAFSSCLEHTENKTGHRQEDSKTRQPRDKDGEGLQVICDVCSVSFRSKTGLMRHRAVKHQKKEDSALLLDAGLAPLETGKRASRKNRKVFKEKEGCSCISNAPVDRPSPKPHRSQRKEPSTEIQEVIHRVLSDLSDISFDITRELRSTTQLSKEMNSKPESLQAARVEETTPKSGREPSSGVRDSDPRAGGSGSFAKKKVRRKVRKGKRKGVSNQNEITGSSPLENKSLEACSQLMPSTANCFPVAELESSSTSAGGQALGQSPLLPCPLTDMAPEADSTGETAGPSPLQVVGSCEGQAENPGPEERVHTQKAWPDGSTKQAEEGLSSVCAKQHDDTGLKEMETKESPLEEASCRRSNSPLVYTAPSPNRLQQPCDSGGAGLKDFPEVISRTASDGTPGPVDSTPWKTQELGPRNGSCGIEATGPDLQSLLDDDSTFSQLFPRNDQFARRKCIRVYGKRSKKPKPVAEVSSKPEVAADLFTIRMASDLGETSSFCVTRDDPCEYETISIDDALMLNMCHGSKVVVSDASPGSARTVPLPTDARQQEDLTESTEESTFGFLCQESPTEDHPDLSSWSGLEKTAKGVSAEGTLLNPSTEFSHGHSAGEANPETPELQEESYNPPVNENQGSPGFHTIDMEMLSTKFEMRDVCFYSIGEDHLSHTDECTLGFKSPSVPQGRGTKNKQDEGKQGKARGDLNLKTKDKQYKCKVCFQWFLTLGELDFHKLTHNPSPPPTCYMCVQRKFSSREQLRDHLKEKHAKNKAGLWACGMCLKEISDVWMYNEHLREHATQFARKGQAQKSALGLPGCFGEDDAAVTHFLNSIMCRKLSKSAKHTEAAGKGPSYKDGKSPKEPPGQEAKVNKDPSESLLRTKPAVVFPKAPAGLSSDTAPKGEGAQRLAPMHPECKDPSRDCHHCGKQFPKPFKLQRHLVVHSLQKIYLCSKCPMFYQETKELRSHLSREHGTAEETDLKHTTLYACELCADVMHVIKKSFICSTCNYTFSKKEQYDRHMEKHLVGSNKTFRFRGVMRPGVFVKDEDKKVKEELHPREGIPAAKKKKLVHHNSWLAQGCAPVPKQGAKPLLPPSESLPTQPPAQATVKTEDLVGDISSLLAEMEKSPFDFLSLPPPPLAPQDRPCDPELGHIAALSMGQLAEGDSLDENPPPFLDSADAVSIDLTSLAHKQAAGRKLSPPHLSETLQPAAVSEDTAFSSRAEHTTGTWDTPLPQEEPVSMLPELSVAEFEATEGKGVRSTQWSNSPPRNDSASQDCVPKVHLSEAAFHVLPLKDKALSSALNQSAKEMPSKKVVGGQAQSEDASSIHSSPDSTEGVQKPPSLKGKAFPALDAYHKDNRPGVGVKETGSNQIKPMSSHLQGEGAGPQAKHNPPDPSKFQDRPIANGLAKLHPKKRKEHKSSHKGSSASRENIEGDGGKKKKIRVPDTVRSDGAGRFKRADWSNGETLALSPRRRDTHCNKLTSKPKMSTAGGQLKKMVLDQCFQKKVEIRHPNGDLKRKKDILGSKTFHHLLAKDPSTSLPSSLNRHRTVQGAKLPDSHNYRTAESQNNLLSQLFGQKLTSFKIPLRRDTSE